MYKLKTANKLWGLKIILQYKSLALSQKQRIIMHQMRKYSKQKNNLKYTLTIPLKKKIPDEDFLMNKLISCLVILKEV